MDLFIYTPGLTHTKETGFFSESPGSNEEFS